MSLNCKAKVKELMYDIVTFHGDVETHSEQVTSSWGKQQLAFLTTRWQQMVTNERCSQD